MKKLTDNGQLAKSKRTMANAKNKLVKSLDQFKVRLVQLDAIEVPWLCQTPARVCVTCIAKHDILS